MELELLKQKLDMLMSSGVSPSRILYDLNVVARSKEVIEKRLEFIKKVGIERIIPWMIKCDDKTLTRLQNLRVKYFRELRMNKL